MSKIPVRLIIAVFDEKNAADEGLIYTTTPPESTRSGGSDS